MTAKEATTMKKKLKLVIPLAAVVVGAGAYFTVFSSKETEAHPKVHGEVYVLPKEFLVNLREGRFAKFTVGLVLEHGALAAAAGGGHGGGPKPPEGFGPLPQEAVVRDIVTDEVTDTSAEDLIRAAGRRKLKRKLQHDIEKHTDVPVEQVLLTDVAVQ